MLWGLEQLWVYRVSVGGGSLDGISWWETRSGKRRC